jgi:hypothetical protein
MLRWSREPFRNGIGNSKAMINPANAIEMTCMMGALMMAVTKKAELGGALMANAVSWQHFEARYMRDC